MQKKPATWAMLACGVLLLTRATFSFGMDDADQEETYYDILGVTPRDAVSEIKAKYRRAALKWHPDKYRDPAQKEKAKARIVLVNQAYEILADECYRTRYNFLLSEGEKRYDSSRDWTAFDEAHGFQKGKRVPIHFNPLKGHVRWDAGSGGGEDEEDWLDAIKFWCSLVGAVACMAVPMMMLGLGPCKAKGKSATGEPKPNAAAAKAKAAAAAAARKAAGLGELSDEDDDDDDDNSDSEEYDELDTVDDDADAEHRRILEWRRMQGLPVDAMAEASDATPPQAVAPRPQGAPQEQVQRLEAPGGAFEAFACKVCKKKYKSSSQLQNHEQSKAHLKLVAAAEREARRANKQPKEQ